ncbi:Hypp6644 [Branchiostoma lanceolatum]|uniref:Hypp6644 protein n=1 Tax=Branchiostoma lanceolatum TaxID=7740 RepID=A0A8K0E501_BRALA|nr:Hypp6644 [Branchiostoma lanceolatum]
MSSSSSSGSLQSFDFSKVRRCTDGELLLVASGEATSKKWSTKSAPSPANPVPGTIQFGQYSGQSFGWLCYNDMGWVIQLLAKHLHERQTNKSQSAKMLNKDSLCTFAFRCPGVAKAVRARQISDSKQTAKSLQSSSQFVGQAGLESVMGFGRYREKTYQDVIENHESCMVGGHSGPAQWPDASRLVEAIFVQLCALHPSASETVGGVTKRRVSVITGEYSHIRRVVMDSDHLKTRTTLQLYEVNQHTFTQWWARRQKKQLATVLNLGLKQPSASAVSAVPTPHPRSKPERIMPAITQPYVFSYPVNTTGQATNIRRGSAPTVVMVTPQQLGRGYIPPVAAQVPSAPVQPVVFVTPQQLGPGYIPPVAAQVPSAPMPRSTKSYYKKRALEEEQGHYRRKYTRKAGGITCSLCGKPKTKEFGHSRFGGEPFCESASTQSKEEWLAQKRAEAAAKKDPPQN